MLGRARPLWIPALLAAACLLAPAHSIAEAEKEQQGGEPEQSHVETPLEQAREESGARERPPARYGLPAGELRIFPSELVAARSGQRIRFSVKIDAPVRGATLEVTLPALWLERAEGGLPFARFHRGVDGSIAGANLERHRKTVALVLDQARPGEVATFEVEDVGIPAGTYRLPFSWRNPDGRLTDAGVAELVFYAPAREARQGYPWERLEAPGVADNVTSDESEESETFIATTPGNKNRIAVGANGGLSMSAWITDDGGQTWGKRTLPNSIDAPGESGFEAGDVCCDPTFAADPLGNIWYGGLSLANGRGVPSRIVVNRIAAATDQFQPLTTGLPARTRGTQDKPMMTIDNSPSSPTFGRLYVVWDEPTPGGGINIVISQCDTRLSGVAAAAHCDDADSWTTPAEVTPLPGDYIYADVAAGPTGHVYVVWWDYSSTNAIQGVVCDANVENCASNTGWGTPQTVAELDDTGGTPIPFACETLAQPGGRASTSPQVDVDHSGGSNTGRVYVTWSDLRPGSGTTRCDGTSDQLPALTDLTFDSYVGSAAGGDLPGAAAPSESVATRLVTNAESAGGSDDWFPWLAVDQTTGQAWADFYSTRLDPNRRLVDFYARSVTPNGTAGHDLGPLVRLSTAPSDYSDPSSCCDFRNDYGDYTGIDATDGVAYPVWTDNGSGSHDGEAFTFVRSVSAGPQPPRSQAPEPQAPGGASAPGSNPARDTEPPRLRLRGRRVARIGRKGKLTVFARSSETCIATLSGKVLITGATRKMAFARLTRSLAGGEGARLNLRPSRRALEGIRRALRRHKRVTVRFALRATDGAGNSGRARHSIRLKL